MNQTELFVMRKRKRIKLKDIAEYIGCSISLLSRYENMSVCMDSDKVIKYERYIKSN
ncbi:helix-turn-helix domain-containing protein [Paenisporosarcina sp. NPDC076898]|uniref:helix-turn-helix domain-containing protein n=1 Tax=unclassified Paenisporosarcina TaxID=2642018 RepID=UPI003D0609D0